VRLPAQRIAAASIIAVLALSGGCGGDGEETAESPSASPTEFASETPRDTETPASTSTAAPEATATPEPPHAAAIVVETGQTILDEKAFEVTLAPGESRAFDARDFSAELGVSITSCLDMSFYLSWQVRQPYPPDGVDLEFYEALRGARLLIVEGVSGQFTRGACVAFEAVNNSAVEVAVELRYAFTE